MLLSSPAPRDRAQAPRFGYLRVVLIVLALYAAMGVALWCVAGAKDVTNEMRGAPALGIWHGARVYQIGLKGVSFSVLYWPLSYLFHLPAALCPGPKSFFLAGSAISFILYCAPLFIFLWRLRTNPEKRLETGLILVTVFVLATLNSPSLALSAFLISPDAAALGFAGAACAVLFFYSGKRPWLEPSLMAAFTCCAVFSKQNMAALVGILPVFALLIGGRRLALRLIVCMAAGAVITIGIVAAVYRDLPAVYFNNIAMPRRFPLRWDHLSGAVRQLYEQSALMVFAIVCLVLAASAGFRYLGRKGLSRGLLFAAMAAGCVPASIAGSIFWGGWLNALSPTLYFVLLTLLAVSYLLLVEMPPEARVRAGVSGVLVVLAAILSPLVAMQADRSAIRRVTASEIVYRYDHEHPGQVYFPYNQVSVFYAEHKFYHAEWGAMNFAMANVPFSRDEVRRHIPPAARYVAYPAAPTRYVLASYLAPHYRRVELPGLPGFDVWELEP